MTPWQYFDHIDQEQPYRAGAQNGEEKVRENTPIASKEKDMGKTNRSRELKKADLKGHWVF